VVDVDLQSYFDSIDHDRLMHLVERRVGDRRVLRLIRAWLKAGVLEEGRITHPSRGTPQGGVISPVLSNIFLHEVDRQWEGGAAGETDEPVRLVRYADDMVLLSRSAEGAQRAWQRFRDQSDGLGLRINAEKSRVTTVTEGFAFLGFECRQRAGRLYLWPRAKAQKHIGERVRGTVRSVPSTAPVDAVIRRLNPVLTGWCTYFRVGNSNRVFHKVDWMVRGELHLWLRRKYQCSRRSVAKRWNYAVLHDRCRLYRLVGKVSHLPELGACRR
jgi:group II intron reverse transcriptase/maturase